MKAPSGALHLRQAGKADVPAMARIRATRLGTPEFWEKRISGYMDCEHHPQKALMPRVIYVACDGDALVGLIAGHLTRRYACDGELEWIDVIAAHRRSGVASELLRLLAQWFSGQKAHRVCVDVNPANLVARRFYTRHGAESLNPHWLVWNDINVVLGKA
jgi:GNAT superfamily N-acetyltransferase